MERDKAEPPVIRVIWQRRHIVGWCVLVSLMSVGVYLLLARPSYSSTAQVLINQGGTHGVMGQTPTDLERSDDYLNTQCQVMLSTPILAMALAEDGVGGLEALWGVGDPVEYLQKNLTVEVGKHSELIFVSFEAHNPVDAAKVVNAVVRAYVTYQTRTQHSTSAEVLDILQKEQARDEAAIAVKNRELATLRNLYGEQAYDNNQNNPIVQQETALSNALTTARLDAVNAKAAYDQAMAMVEHDQDTLKQVIAPDDAGDLVAASAAQLDMLRAEIFRLGQSLKDLERTYMPNHPALVQVRSRLQQLTVTYVRAQRQHWLTAKAQQDALQTSFDEQHREVLSQATRSADFDRVRTELSRIERDLDIVENRTNEVSVNQDAGSLNISVTQPAAPSDRPSHPAKLKDLAGAMVIGLLAGCGLALAREKFPTGPRRIDRLSEEFGSPILGMLPGMDGMGTLAMRATATHLEPAGAVAEAARGIVRTMAELGLDDEGGRTLLVTSLNPLEGRTTLATNLALAMAQGGMKVLLVDANSRSPRLHHIFNISNSFGLFDVLGGQTADQPAINGARIENVDVLTCGKVPPNAVERLNNEALVDVLGELSDRYDRVIVDSPALGRGVEARILAANCAAVVLVATARPTARRQIEQGLRMLRSVGANVLGLVLNEPGSIDPLKALGADPGAARSALSSEKARTYRPAIAAGTED